MSDWRVPQKVRRNHTIERIGSDTVEVMGVGPCLVHSMREKYNGKIVDSWSENEKGKIVQVCLQEPCERYNLIKEFSKICPNTPLESWMCPDCTAVEDADLARKQSKADYRRLFPKRIMAFSRALKKKYPEYNSRKSRLKGNKGNWLVLNGTEWGNDKQMRKNINYLGYEFNLHIGEYMEQDDNGEHNRVRVKIQDISPMFDEHFRDHGHKGGIKERNR